MRGWQKNRKVVYNKGGMRKTSDNSDVQAGRSDEKD